MAPDGRFADSLTDTPLLFEPVPPSPRSSAVRRGRYTDQLLDLIRSVPRVTALNVPELVDENHEGRPYYRSGDAREFAQTLAQATDREVVVNKVVAHLPSVSALEEWTRDSVDRGVRNIVLVGGSSRYIPYPGPPVIEANRAARAVLEPAGGRLGNIAIPQRTGEAHRMVAKTKAGASFFTTQILFDSESALRLVRDYDRRCREADCAPAAVLLSFASITEESDAEFVEWLGADLPERVARSILGAEEADAGPRSVENAVRVWEEVRRGYAPSEAPVPLGVNVEQVNQRHLTPAGELLRTFAERLGH